ncbi:MAG: polysaccharide biosynthesis C-terminal domain-containing protein [Lachnospiraceae bacterium]|nr:polysaccharide biosynthesis C-terminal domain-containing protein [Lachnospiraceae bacterium]
MKKNALFLNTATSLLLEVVTIISGFIVPRLILRSYGSDINGLVHSITEFLAIITYFEMGVGSVVRFNLYKPLNNGDDLQLSRIVKAANIFFRRLAKGLLVYVVILMLVYPIISRSQFGHLSTAFLILSMSVSSFAQYYFGQVNQILVTADEKGYIQYLANIVVILLNMLVCVILIRSGATIQVVKLGAAIVFLTKPVFLQWYVKQHYHIDPAVDYDEEPIKQKWNGVAQHISAVVLDNTDVIILTSLSTLANVSIYSTYNMVVRGLKKMLSTSVSGIQSRLGTLIAREHDQQLFRLFSLSEWTIHTITTFLFSCTCTLIVPFVMVYTRGVTDADYYVPIFATLITLATASFCYRIPYSILILSAGHYKQTQHNYIIAVVMNIVLSIILVYRYGLIGVAVGTLAAMIYQTVWMAWYCYTKLLVRPLLLFLKQIGTDIITFLLAVLLSQHFVNYELNYLSWMILAIKVSCLTVLILLAVNAMLYRQNMMALIDRLFKRK